MKTISVSFALVIAAVSSSAVKLQTPNDCKTLPPGGLCLSDLFLIKRLFHQKNPNNLKHNFTTFYGYFAIAYTLNDLTM